MLNPWWVLRLIVLPEVRQAHELERSWADVVAYVHCHHEFRGDDRDSHELAMDVLLPTWCLA